MEKWRAIEGFEAYEISNQGNVRSTKTKRKLHLFTNGEYMYCSLFQRKKEERCNGKRYAWRSVHRLVAKAFLPNPNGLPVVNHKDGNKRNNDVSNLEWCTQSYNNFHAWNVICACDRERPYQYKRVMCVETRTVYESIKAAQATFNSKGCSVGACLRGRNKSAYGFHWCYVDTEKGDEHEQTADKVS